MAKKEQEVKRKPGRPKKVKTEEVVENKKPKKALSTAGSICLIIAIAVLIFIILVKQGPAGVIASNVLSFVFGNFYFVVLLTVLFFAIKELFFSKKGKLPLNILVGIIFLNIAVIMLSSLIANNNQGLSFGYFKDLFINLKKIASVSANYQGGLIGTLLYAGASTLFGSAGALITLVVFFVISAILIIPLTYFKKAAIASKDAVVNTANNIEVARNAKEEKRRLEQERLKELQNQNVLNTIQDISADIEEDNTDEVTVKDDNRDVEYVKNVSGFSKNYFIDADGDGKPDDLDFEDTPINSKDDLDELQNVSVTKAENPRPVKNVQTKLEDAAEPKLEGPKNLRRVSNFRNYKLPNPAELLSRSSNSKSSKNESAAERRGKELIKILSNFGIRATLDCYHVGPSVTKFEIKPDATVNLNKINALSDNIKMGLAATSIRIEAPIPGKNAVGVEVPNAENTPVRMADLITAIPKSKAGNKLLFALGKDLSGTPIFCDLAKMPHLLIAGATGSGKSVCINTIITSYLLKTKPDEVKMILVDPKKVEFTPYHDIPHLLWPVITDAKTASLMLKKMVVMMEERYDAFAKAAVRDITSYNEKVVEYNKNLKEGQSPMTKLPYIVVIIDELADLMQTSKNEVESSITRITQLARASGIHLIVATQRPSTDVITGLIKSNIPSRISFAVSSAIDSRTILDMAGAEELLGNGDMLYSPQGENVPKRLQGCWVTDSEIEKITNYVKAQAKPEYDDTYFALQNANASGGSNATSGEEDDLYQEVVDFIAKTKKASTSSLQRRFGIGYNRAARLIDTLEENGLIGPSNGSKPREVYVRSKDKQD